MLDYRISSIWGIKMIYVFAKCQVLSVTPAYIISLSSPSHPIHIFCHIAEKDVRLGSKMPMEAMQLESSGLRAIGREPKFSVLQDFCVDTVFT